jgi:hypothetical protein
VPADDKLTAFLEFEAAISGTRFQGGGANQVRLSFGIPSTTGRVWQVQTTCSIWRCLISSTLNRYFAAPDSLLTARDEVLQRAFRSSVPTFDTRYRRWRQSSLDTRYELIFDLLLDMMHHGDGSNKNDRRDYLVRVKACMEKAPCDAHGGERLHHFKITGS